MLRFLWDHTQRLFFAHLFLYYYENKWIKKIKKTGMRMARRFTNTFRFIGDLAVLNDIGESGFLKKKIVNTVLKSDQRQLYMHNVIDGRHML